MKTTTPIYAQRIKLSVASAPKSATLTETAMQLKKRCINCNPTPPPPPPGKTSIEHLPPSALRGRMPLHRNSKKLKNDSEIQNNKTYTNIVKTTIKEATPPAKPVINLTDKHDLKWVILILEAHIASIGDGTPYNVILQESFNANNLDVIIPNRDAQKIMDIYLNPKQKQKDHAPEEFLYESSSSSDDESSDEEEHQPPQTEDEAPPQTEEQSDNQKNGKKEEKFSRINFSPS